ncbi:hypothetical protein BD414DRAFT_491938 [Trametes punicea]|nr:hypothetical protein BD414DRAFT_491938 [Trametes punicea]
MASLNARSPIFRSMSRSSFCSSSCMDSSPPCDYPTPASDSSVTTPAPSEATFGWLPGHRDALFGQDVPFSLEAKGKQRECDYPQDFLRTAPLSPDAFLTYPFDVGPQEVYIAPSNVPGALAGARRHSEPANLAALQFPLFFQDHLQILPPPPLEDAAMLPIANSNPCTSANQPSSIAPHETELPRPLEIKQPRPVRAYKPPILSVDHKYDPKDFVRRYSEPVLPLRELDVFSHLPSDTSEESPEDADDMMFEEAAEEGNEEEDCYDDTGDEVVRDDFPCEAGLDMQGTSEDSHGAPLFDPRWSWLQPPYDPSVPLHAWPGADVLATDIDWTTVFAYPPTSDFPFALQSNGTQHG